MLGNNWKKPTYKLKPVYVLIIQESSEQNWQNVDGVVCVYRNSKDNPVCGWVFPIKSYFHSESINTVLSGYC